MKLKIVAAMLLVITMSIAVVNTASARPWGCHRIWYGPHFRLAVPAPIIVGDGYCAPNYHGGKRYYGSYHHGWDHEGFRGGYSHGYGRGWRR